MDKSPKLRTLTVKVSCNEPFWITTWLQKADLIASPAGDFFLAMEKACITRPNVSLNIVAEERINKMEDGIFLPMLPDKLAERRGCNANSLHRRITTLEPEHLQHITLRPRTKRTIATGYCEWELKVPNERAEATRLQAYEQLHYSASTALSSTKKDIMLHNGGKVYRLGGRCALLWRVHGLM